MFLSVGRVRQLSPRYDETLMWICLGIGVSWDHSLEESQVPANDSEQGSDTKRALIITAKGQAILPGA